MKLQDLNLSDYQEFVQDFHGESDRAAVVLAGSFAESFLGNYIRNFMLDAPEAKKDIDQVLNGTLSSFDSRIKIAYAFRLISKQHRDDLLRIKDIRNRFAHSPKSISLNQEDMQRDVRSLSLWSVVKDNERSTESERSDRSVILITVGMFVAFAHNRILDLRAQSLNSESVPSSDKETTDRKTDPPLWWAGR